VHYVGASGATAWPYTTGRRRQSTIQDGVDAASSNDTVLVSNGVYETGGQVVHGSMSTGWRLPSPLQCRA